MAHTNEAILLKKYSQKVVDLPDSEMNHLVSTSLIPPCYNLSLLQSNEESKGYSTENTQGVRPESPVFVTAEGI